MKVEPITEILPYYYLKKQVIYKNLNKYKKKTDKNFEQILEELMNAK